jgi:hypothetical protein
MIINQWKDCVGLEVLTTAVMSALFWDITPWSVEIQPMIQRKIAPPSSGSKNKLRKIPA